MIKIENKKTEINGKEIMYSDLMESCCENVPEKGVSSSEQLKRIRLLDKIGAGKNGFIELEDADFDSLLAVQEKMNWGVIDKEIGAFIEYLKSLKTKK